MKRKKATYKCPLCKFTHRDGCQMIVHLMSHPKKAR